MKNILKLKTKLINIYIKDKHHTLKIFGLPFNGRGAELIGPDSHFKAYLINK
jgi:hypothetical protein